jgi:hypothetical protein
MKNRRDANRCARRAAELLAQMEARERHKTTTDALDETSGRGDADH